MRAVVQRVNRAGVTVDGESVGAIGTGLLVLLGVTHSDTPAEAAWLAEKLVHLRLFPDDAGKMNLDVSQVKGGILVVSQFTLYGDCRKGRRPGFGAAADPGSAEPLYEEFIRRIRMEGVPTAAGRFGASMQVELVNDGPVTLILETPGNDGETRG